MQEAFGGGDFDFYTGTAYRHCMVWHGGQTELGAVTPPHDITGRVIGGYLPRHPDAAPLLDMMERSYALLSDHPINRRGWPRGFRRPTPSGCGGRASAPGWSGSRIGSG